MGFHLKVPQSAHRNAQIPLILTVEVVLSLWIDLSSILTVCLQSWHLVQLITEAAPSCALTPSTTTRAPTRTRPELSATAELDSLYWMTGERVEVSISMFFIFPCNILPESSVDALQALPINNTACTEACSSTTGNLLHMFHVSDVSWPTDEHTWSELWNLRLHDHIVWHLLYILSQCCTCLLTDNLSFVRAISGWCWYYFWTVLLSVCTLTDSPVQTLWFDWL